VSLNCFPFFTGRRIINPSGPMREVEAEHHVARAGVGECFGKEGHGRSLQMLKLLSDVP